MSLALFGGEKVKTTPYGTGKRFGKEELANLEEALNQNKHGPGGPWPKGDSSCSKCLKLSPFGWPFPGGLLSVSQIFLLLLPTAAVIAIHLILAFPPFLTSAFLT